jgi:hypothetical protein
VATARSKGLDASYGAGTFNRNTGAFVVTLGALPDVGSSLVLTWNVPTQETQQPSTTLKAAQSLALNPPAGTAVQPGSLTVSWEYGGTKTATAATSGVLSGAATGSLSVAQNRVDFAPNVLPAVGTQLTVSYVAGPKQEDSFAHPSRNGSGLLPVTATLGAIEPGSLEVEWNTFTDEAVLGAYTFAQLQEMGIAVSIWRDPTQIARDDGNGGVVLNGISIGTVNYATGQVTFNPDVSIRIPRPVYTAVAINGTGRWRLNYGGIAYVDAPSLYPNDESGYVKLRYNSAGSTSNQTETSVPPGLQAGAGGECPGGDGHGASLHQWRAALGRQRPGHPARVHHQWLGHARHDQLPVRGRGADVLDGGHEQRDHASQLRDHGRREHLQRVRVPNWRGTASSWVAVDPVRPRGWWHAKRDGRN